MVEMRPFAGVDWSQVGACDLRISEACKRYDGFALRDVSLVVPRGAVVGLVGRNGAGKTTLMQLVTGATRLDAGTVELFGRDLATCTAAEQAELRQRLGYVGATIAYPHSMRVSDVRRMYELAYPAFSVAEFERICRAMDLDAWERKIPDLSRGMGMKLQLACVLASGADLLLLDEPTAGLDPIVREELLDLLRSWMEDERHSLLISSHITSDLEGFADYVALIDGGRLLLSMEADVIGEVMGVAHLRTGELERVAAAWPFGQTQLHVIHGELGWRLLVPERPVFRLAFPELACDRATIDDLLTFSVKGEVYGGEPAAANPISTIGSNGNSAPVERDW